MATTKKVVKKASKPPVKKKTGRPSNEEAEKKRLQQEEDFEYICQEIDKGEALRNVVGSFMSSATFFDIMRDDEIKQKRYARACEARANSIFEDIIDISNESNADVVIGEGGQLKIDGEAVSRSRLKIDARKWILAKLDPKKYGDKLENINTNLNLNVDDIDYSKLSDAALEEIANARGKAIE